MLYLKSPEFCKSGEEDEFSLKPYIEAIAFQEPQVKDNLAIFPLMVNGGEKEVPAYLLSSLAPVPGQSRIAVFINNRFVCLDLFDCPDTLQKLWIKLLFAGEL